MPVKGFYAAIGNDSPIIENKWLLDLENKFPDHTWLRYNMAIDTVDFRAVAMEYFSENLFSSGTCIVIRHADKKQQEVETFLSELLENPIKENTVILIQDTCNKTTRLGKLLKDKFSCSEFEKQEIKPFDLLDALNTKRLNKVLQFSSLLFDADYNPLALFSLLLNHFLFLRKLREVEGLGIDGAAKKLGQHRFRIQKALPAFHYWAVSDIDRALLELSKLDKNIRTWQYDERTLIEMFLINICL